MPKNLFVPLTRVKCKKTKALRRLAQAREDDRSHDYVTDHAYAMPESM